MTRVCVLIPAFNAADSLGPLIERARPLGHEMLVIDDGSTDDTARVAERAGATVLRHASNQGKGAALRTGFAEALRRGHELIITLDADGQHDPADIPRFVQAALDDPQAALLIGNRMHEAHRMPFVRRCTNRIMSWWLSRAAGTTVPDTQCGFRLMRRDFLTRCRLASGRFEIESEMVLEAARLHAPIRAVPVRSIYGEERSHIRPCRDTWRFFRMLAGYRRAQRGS